MSTITRKYFYQVPQIISLNGQEFAIMSRVPTAPGSTPSDVLVPISLILGDDAGGYVGAHDASGGTLPSSAGLTEGKFYVVKVAGTIAGVPLTTFSKIRWNGAAFDLIPAPPTIIPDETITLALIAQEVRALMAANDDYQGYLEIRRDATGRAFFAVKSDGSVVLKIAAESVPQIGTANLANEAVTRDKAAQAIRPALPTSDEYNGKVAIWRDDAGRTYMVWKTDGSVVLKLAPESYPPPSIPADFITLEMLADEIADKLPVTDDFNDYLFVRRDPSGRRLYAVRKDGTFEAKIEGVEGFPALQSEVEAARGTTASLSARLAGVVTSAGRLDRHRWGEWLLRSYQWKSRRLANSQAEKLSVVCLGDSWTHNQYRLTEPLRRRLATDFGAAGGGFFGFTYFNDSGAVNGCADATLMTGSHSTGNWTSVWNVAGAVYGLDAQHLYSTTVGAWVQVNILTAHTSCRVHYRKQAGGGTFRYQIDGGAWTSISTDAVAGYGIADIVIPAAACVLRFEVETAGSAGVILNGIDAQTATGVVIHKLGQSGGTAANHLNYVNEAHWLEGLDYLAPDLVTIMFATNEQNGNVAPDTLRANLVTLGNRVRTARPLCDLLLICPAENGLTGKTYTMAQYRDAVYAAAVELGAGFLDLYKIFGAFSTYEYSTDGSTRNLFNSDDIHPNTDGAYVLSNAVYQFLNAL